MTITNRTQTLRLLFIEPEAMDFWMRPEETFQVSADVDSHDANFELWDTPEGITVFPGSGMDSISVFCGTVELECSHQRPSSWH
jgi:hypothetical protein